MEPLVHPGDIWDNPAFYRDEAAFQLLYKLVERPHDVLLTNARHSALLARTSPELAMWIWCAAARNDLLDLLDALMHRVPEASELSFCGRPEVMGLLMQQYARQKGGIAAYKTGMIAYICPAVRRHKSPRGGLSRMREEERERIAAGVMGFHLDCFGQAGSQKEAGDAAKELCDNPNFYAWRDEQEKIACMANISHRSVRHARINTVYTFPECRGQGFAGMCVGALCHKILAEGLTPMLYADRANPVSNHVYRNIGFIACGEMETWSWHT